VAANRFVLLMSLLLCGCAVAPVQEMSNARQAIAVAERMLVANQAGQDSLLAARAALADAENSLHHYEFHLARDQALKARQLALAAQEAARTAPSYR